MVYVVYGITKYLVSIYTTKLKEGFSMGKIIGLTFEENKEEKKKPAKKENKEGAE